MKTTVIQEFSKEDIELLKIRLPRDPCYLCKGGSACCGCPPKKEYLQKIQPYKDLNIYEIAKELRDVEEKLERLNTELTETLEEIELTKKSIPDYIKELIS